MYVERGFFFLCVFSERSIIHVRFRQKLPFCKYVFNIEVNDMPYIQVLIDLLPKLTKTLNMNSSEN